MKYIHKHAYKFPSFGKYLALTLAQLFFANVRVGLLSASKTDLWSIPGAGWKCLISVAVAASLISESLLWLVVVVLPFFLHYALIFRVLTPSVAASISGESLTLGITVTCVRVIFSFLFSVIPPVPWSALRRSAGSKQAWFGPCF